VVLAAGYGTRLLPATKSQPKEMLPLVDRPIIHYSVEEAVESCKDGVQATADQLSEELRGELEDLCDKAASGDDEDVRDAAIEACKKVIEETVPEGAGRDQALDACENSG